MPHQKCVFASPGAGIAPWRSLELVPSRIRSAPLRLGVIAYHGEDDTRERFIYEAALPVAPEVLSLREGQGMALIARDALPSYRIVPLHREILDGFYAAWSG